MSNICLTIAGFDSSGGAGLQADLKTFTAFGCYGMTVLTALPIQNTGGVRQCFEIPLEAIHAQLEAIFDDIVPDSIKIGMLFNNEIIALVADFLKTHARGIPLVLDPVMISKNGNPLLQANAIEQLKQDLIPLATLITPNLPEAQTLIPNSTNALDLAQRLLELGSHAVLLKGGHTDSIECNDLYLDQEARTQWLNRPRIKTQNTHGTGCTLSAAITAQLAKKVELLQACKDAKSYVHAAIMTNQSTVIGHGHGPVDPFPILNPIKMQTLKCTEPP